MDELTEDQMHALRSLARKKAGAEIPFIKIAEARALTDLGLAARSAEGWDITAAGAAVIARATPLSNGESDQPPPTPLRAVDES